ncbi:hypothetical protein AAMO2058_001661200 [Amorphochlora amoebiformis]|mmetsp:Transcript_19611/g.31143  ORF Transcript_19611/g.31143 Transcript_19611/m.31143 type:complete len:370 (-) Transcript_19611:627-1736(-)
MQLSSVLLVSFAVLASGKPRVSHEDLRAGVSYTFDEYLVDFKKSYPDSQYGYRKSLFVKHLAIIREHNKKNLSWHMHVNDFTDLHPEEFRRSTKGFHHPKHATLVGSGNPFPADVNKDFLATLPTTVDWRTKNVVTPVKNQGGCGSCWAFSAAETMESHLAIATGKLLELSEQQLVACSTNPKDCGGTGGCDGSVQPLAFDYVQTVGITTEKSYPYEGITGTCKPNSIKPVVNITGQVDLPTNNYTALMEAVAMVGPVAISLDAGGLPWQLYGGGVLTGDCGSDIDHAVQLVGYGTENGKDYWLVRNSWGQGWGEGGYIKLYRDPNAACAQDATPQDGFGCDGGPKEVTVCGMCGILSASSYPLGAYLI